MARQKDVSWNVGDKPETWEQVNCAVLMDIRDELKTLNRSMDQMNSAAARMDLVLRCHNTTRIPQILDKIAVNTRKPKRKKKI
jgi:hypothetical protein